MGFILFLRQTDCLLHVTVGSIEMACIAFKLCAIDVAVVCIGKFLNKVFNELGIVGGVKSRTCHKHRQVGLIQLVWQVFLNADAAQCRIVDAESVDFQTVGHRGTDGIADGIGGRCRLLHDADDFSLFVQQWGTG